MPRGIPKPVYPIALDSDYTLFKVKNSSKTTLAKDLGKTDDVIEIVPQSQNGVELWPENGFVTIADELIYYDAVGLDDNGKVCQLKDCIREVEGTKDFYRVGTSVAANVVAQTHNQLVDAVIAIEEALGDIGDILKLGPQLKAQQSVRRNLLPPSKVNALAAMTTPAFAAPLNASLSSMVGCCPQVGDDACPDVEFEFNNMGGVAEYCIRIFGNYHSFQIDFGDGLVENTQLSGVHQYINVGPWNPTVTVCAANCCIVQSPTPPNEFCCGINLPNPSVPFVVQIPDIPAFPEFVAPKQICPGPLLNLPPILMPEVNLCPSVASCSPSLIVSVIEACRTPQIIQIVSPCKISVISLDGCNIPSVISLVGCCMPSIVSFDVVVDVSIEPICFCEPPSFAPISFGEISFDPICFCEPPSFNVISFAPFPSVENVRFSVVLDISMEPICFCEPPSFGLISFADFPSIQLVSFDVVVDLSIEPICFCEPPSFACISFCEPPSFAHLSFDPICFCEPPSFDVISFAPFPSVENVRFSVVLDISMEPICFCEPPTFPCISFCELPTFPCISFCTPTISVDWGTPPVVRVSIICPSTSPSSMAGPMFAGPTLSSPDDTEDNIPINLNELLPSEIKLVVPKINDIKLTHDIPMEIKLVGQPIPDAITVRGDIPKSIEIIHNFPDRIMLDATDVPRKILVELAPNFPSTLKMEIIGMPQTLQVTGIPKTIEIIENIPRTIQLLMPPDPVIELKYLGAALELKPSPDLEKILMNLVIPQR